MELRQAGTCQYYGNLSNNYADPVMSDAHLYEMFYLYLIVLFTKKSKLSNISQSQTNT
jgi:hypothetical protein